MKLLNLLRQMYDEQTDPNNSQLCVLIDCHGQQCTNCPVNPLQSWDDLIVRMKLLNETPESAP